MSTNNSGSSGNAGKGGVTVASNTSETQVNMERLVEKVYRLMLADLAVQIRRNNGERR